MIVQLQWIDDGEEEDTNGSEEGILSQEGNCFFTK